jgi:hypothetical protein
MRFSAKAPLPGSRRGSAGTSLDKLISDDSATLPDTAQYMAVTSRSLAVRLFVSCWLVYSVFWTPYIVREHFPAMSLSETGALDVSRYYGWTEDIFRGPRGGAYINNNPGASLTAAIPLAILRPWFKRYDYAPPLNTSHITAGALLRRAAVEGRARYFMLIAFTTVALVMAPASAFAIAFLGLRLRQAGVSTRSAALVAILCAFGTPVFYRTEYLNHNMLVANAGLVALLLLWDPDGRPLARWKAWAAGALCGYALLCDFSALVVGGTVALYLYWRAGDGKQSRIAMLARFAAAALPFGFALLLYQAVAFGNFLLPSQQYMAPTAPTSHGYRGFDWPSPALLWANFFDPRFGLFVYCPLLVLGLASWWIRHVRHPLPRREQSLILLYFGGMVLFCAANQYSWLQPSTGFRYLIPVVPCLLLLTVHVFQALPRALAGGLGAASVLLSWAMASWRYNRPDEALAATLADGFPLPWIRHLSELSIVTRPGWMTAGCYGALAAALWLTWTVGRHRRHSATEPAYPPRCGDRF